MAGDWLKFDKSTPDKPEVWAMAEILGIDPDAVIGKLLRVWSWFDEQSEEGNAPSVSKMLLDRKVGVTGFCDAMIKCGWMDSIDTGVSLPNFDRHNGKTAKNRALTAKRVAKHKTESNAKGNEKVTSIPLPREEKRREESKPPYIPPPSVSSIEAETDTDTKINTGKNTSQPDFSEFWILYPSKTNKLKAEQAWKKIKPTPDTLSAIAENIAARLEAGDWSIEEKQFIPHASTYLNQRRWEDEVIPKGNQNGPDKPANKRLSEVDRVREANAKRAEEREKTLSGQREAADDGGGFLGADDGDIHPHLDKQVRGHTYS